MKEKGFDGLFLVAICLVAFMAFNICQDRDELKTAQAAVAPSVENTAAINESGPDAAAQHARLDSRLILPSTLAQANATREKASNPETDPRAFAPPYDKFDLTQGLHGASYGHLAIDIAAGNGAQIKSPINGVISALYTDEWGNTTLVVENEVYQVMFLHGLYTVSLGDTVQIGDLLGTESNQGNTVDAYGQSCLGRDCGYHTHLNVYDKILGENVNPLNLLGFDQD